MTDRAPKTGRSVVRHLMSLCHTDDCCPQVYHDETAEDECCIRVVDDYGNEAFFGPASLLAAPLLPVGNPPDWFMKDAFGGEVYMSPDQYAMLRRGDNLAMLREVADARGIAMIPSVMSV